MQQLSDEVGVLRFCRWIRLPGCETVTLGPKSDWITLSSRTQSTVQWYISTA